MNDIQDIKNAIASLTLFKEFKETKESGFAKFGYCDLAIEALKEKAERESPKPLTMEELKEYADHPIWHKSLQGNESKWIVLDYCVAIFPEQYNYGKNWVAYKYEPKEENNG